MLINALFLLLWRVIPPKLPNVGLKSQLSLMALIGLSGWAICAALCIGALQLKLISPVLEGSLALPWRYCWGSGRPAMRHQPPKGPKEVSIVMLLSRVRLQQLRLALRFLSSLGIAILAGMASVFPAIFLTTMVSVWLAQGHSVQAGAVGPMMLGSSSVSGYALLCAWLFPIIGPTFGALAAWVLSVLTCSGLALWWMRRNKSAVLNSGYFATLVYRRHTLDRMVDAHLNLFFCLRSDTFTTAQERHCLPSHHHPLLNQRQLKRTSSRL